MRDFSVFISTAIYIVFYCRQSLPAQERVPLPAVADVAAAKKLIGDVYKKEFEAAKGAAEQKKLADKLLKDAKESQRGSAEQLALLTTSRELFTKIGDLDAGLANIEFTAGVFQQNQGTLARQFFSGVAPQAKLPADRHLLLRYLTVAYFESVRDDRLDDATALVDLIVSTAKETNEVDLTKQWVRRQEALPLRVAEQAKFKQAAAVLEKSPSDKEANAVCGQYTCFYLKDWEKGLPMLALGPPSPGQKLAEKEVRGATTPEERVALGDGWYDEAQRNAGGVKNAMLARSGKYYEQVVGTLAALAKRKVENRLEETHRAGEPLPKNEWIELVDFVSFGSLADPKVWQRRLGAVTTSYDDVSWLHFPVIVDGPYEIHIQATRHSGPDQFGLNLSRTANNDSFIFDCMAGELSGLAQVNGKGVFDNGTRIAPSNPPNGKPYLLSVYVDRKDGKSSIVAKVNDKPYFNWSGNTDALRGDLGQRGALIRIQSWKTNLVIHSVRLRIKSGDGWLVE